MLCKFVEMYRKYEKIFSTSTILLCKTIISTLVMHTNRWLLLPKDNSVPSSLWEQETQSGPFFIDFFTRSKTYKFEDISSPLLLSFHHVSYVSLRNQYTQFSPSDLTLLSGCKIFLIWQQEQHQLPIVTIILVN